MSDSSRISVEPCFCVRQVGLGLWVVQSKIVSHMAIVGAWHVVQANLRVQLTF